MINWVSNVFPGVLGRTCDRPCEPACRRGRVEGQSDERKPGSEKPEPVAICRLKRVAADYKDDIRGRPAQGRAPQRQAHRLRGRRARLAHGRTRPGAARLPRDRVRLGPPGRRHDPLADPQVPPARIGHRRGDRLHPRPRRGFQGRASHRLAEGAAGRRLRRRLHRLRRPARARPRHSRPARGRRAHPHRHRLALVGVLRPRDEDRPARDRPGGRQHGDRIAAAPPGAWAART
jgi:hypothetical protein